MNDRCGPDGRVGWTEGSDAPLADVRSDKDHATQLVQMGVRREPVFALDALDAYRDTGHELIPLHAPDDLDQNGRAIGKAPVKGWRTEPHLTVEEARVHMADGKNVGVRLRSTDLVIDVDPRNFFENDDPLARLASDLKVDLSEYPTVITGSGGKHIYMTKPEHELLRDTLEAYQGIEFKTLGRQVVAAGSAHPETLLPYQWDDDPLAMPLSSVQPAPKKLIEMARRAKPAISVGAGERSPEQLAEMLEGLDPIAYRDHGKWLELMMACHHATAGEGRDEWIEWSTSDPSYAGDAWIIGRRWDSLQADQDGRRITERTLFKALVDAGRQDLLPRVPTQDFPDDLSGDPPEARTEAERQLAKVNGTHFTVLTGGKYLVGRELLDPLSSHRKVEWYHDTDVRKFLDVHSVEVAPGKRKPLGGWWTTHPGRRQYQGVVFDPTPGVKHPGYYNLWTGWARSAVPGDWSLLKTLLREVLCGGDEESYRYALRWAAFMVQKPQVPAEVALVFKGPKGIGKGTFGRALTTLAGAHGRQVAQPSHFTGQFNEHLSDTIVLFVDEGLWAGDKKLEGALKNLITEPTLTFEGKFKPLVTGPNRLHVVIASNEAWVIPASPDERRFAVFEASQKARDRLPDNFFEALNRQLDEGGYEAMLAELQGMELGDWHPRKAIPQTRALLDQKLQGFRSDPLAFWWHRCLEDGVAAYGFGSNVWSEGSLEIGSSCKDAMLAALNDTARSMGKRSEYTKTAIAKFLGTVGADVSARDRRGGKIWSIPRLAEAREAFEEAIGGALPWE